MPLSRKALALTFLAAAVVTSVFFIDLCNFAYSCGCRSLWAGAASECNIHHAGSRHCPWCSVGTAGGILVYSAILAAQAAVVYLGPGEDWKVRLVLAIVAFPIAGLAIAAAMGLSTGYWQ
jgi:hypothetical protein